MNRSAGRLWARWAFDPGLGVCEGFALEWREGKFTRAAVCARPPRDFKPDEIYGEALLTPGLLNAHAHLNFGKGIEDLPRGSFARWLEAIIARMRAARAQPEPEKEAEVAEAGLLELLRDGATEIWDIATLPYGRDAMLQRGVAGLSFVELIAPDGANTDATWEKWLARWEDHQAQCGAALTTGCSPHASYTIAPKILAKLAAWNREQRRPLAMHAAESPEEIELLLSGSGPLREVLAAAGPSAIAAQSPHCGAIKLAAHAGLLGPHFLAIHANLPQVGETELLAQSGAPVAFCPRSHAWFDYPAYPLNKYHAAGVRLALGTDSLASNDRLSVRAELEHVINHWQDARDWEPRELLGLATGALLGEEPPYGGRGRLAVGFAARWALWGIGMNEGAHSEEKMLRELLEARLARSSAFDFEG